jgi:hypothetical protein
LTGSNKFGVDCQFRRLFVLKGLDELGVETSKAGPEGEECVEQVKDTFPDRLREDGAKAFVGDAVTVDNQI